MSDNETKNSPEHKQAFEKRRKLLKASAITPLVATLPSGVAQATASAFQCVGGDFSVKHACPSSAVPPPDGVLDSPNWLNGNSCGSDNAIRNILTVYYEPLIEKKGEDAGKLVCRTPTEGELIYELPNTGVLHHGEGHGGEYSGDYVKPANAGWVLYPAENELCYAGKSEVLVMFDVNDDATAADVVGVWPEKIENDGYLALTGSCMTSIADQNVLSNSGDINLL